MLDKKELLIVFLLLLEPISAEYKTLMKQTRFCTGFDTVADRVEFILWCAIRHITKVRRAHCQFWVDKLSSEISLFDRFEAGIAANEIRDECDRQRAADRAGNASCDIGRVAPS